MGFDPDIEGWEALRKQQKVFQVQEWSEEMQGELCGGNEQINPPV